MIDKLIKPVSELLDKFIPDADTKQKIAHEIATMSQKHIHEISSVPCDKGIWKRQPDDLGLSLCDARALMSQEGLFLIRR